MRSSITLGLSALLLSLTAQAVARPDLNAFLNRKVRTTRGLVAQIKSDPQVADRYQRHFAMSKDEVVDYVGALHRDTLDEDGTYKVYSVPKGGHLAMHVQKLKKGEPVFVNRAGDPVLIVKCGNPLTLGPLRPNRGNTVVMRPGDPIGYKDVPFEEPDATALDSPINLVALMPAVPTIPEPPTTPPEVVIIPPVEPPLATVPASAIGGGGGRFPWFAGLPLLIPIFGSIGNGGGGGDQPVPEPATMVVLGVGAAAMIRRKRKA